jgi:hypothetical protein
MRVKHLYEKAAPKMLVKLTKEVWKEGGNRRPIFSDSFSLFLKKKTAETIAEAVEAYSTNFFSVTYMNMAIKNGICIFKKSYRIVHRCKVALSYFRRLKYNLIQSQKYLLFNELIDIP